MMQNSLGINYKLLLILSVMVIVIAVFVFLRQNVTSPTPSNELVSMVSIYQPDQFSEDQKLLYKDVYWSMLKPFNTNDEIREVYVVTCGDSGSNPPIYPLAYPVSVPNVRNILETTLKYMITNGPNGFPKNSDINGIRLSSDGTLAINFSITAGNYGGGSMMVQCLSESVELTAKQFPEVKNVIMCIDDWPNETNHNCGVYFQP